MSIHLVNDDAMEYIIENTITECNRVLNNWKHNKKPVEYEDKISLFRSYLAKFFKHKFGYGAYHRYIRLYHPLVVIDNYLVIDIDFNISAANLAPNIYLTSLDRYAKRMDIQKFSELQDLRPTKIIEGSGEEYDLSDLVDYKKLCNINFN